MSIYRQGPSPAGSCPRCRETLQDVLTAKGVRRCPQCGGVFADNEQSKRIVSTMDHALLEIGFYAGQGKPRAKDTGRRLSCPECLVDMQRIRVESAACFIDACPAHGSWFDPGELYDVMRAYARSREAGVPSPNRAPPSPQDLELQATQAAAEKAYGPGAPFNLATFVTNLLGDRPKKKA